jgi:glycosyltransferase involved in cell wall biosynthesis
MRILHVVQALSRKFGGTQTVLLDLARTQIQIGLDVEVATTNIDAPSGVLKVPTDRIVNVDGVQARYFPVQFRELLYSRQFKYFIDNEITRFGIIHIHGLYRFPSTYTAYQARKQRVPYVISPHGALDPFLYRKSSRSVLLKRLYERWFELPNLRMAGSIHYTAEGERKLTEFLGLNAPSFVVPNGIDWQKFVHLPGPGAFRNAHNLGDVPLVLFLGRLHVKKGLDLLITAFDDVCRKIPNVKLAIVGPENDDYGQKVRRWVHERGLDSHVHFIGHLDYDEVIQAYVDADVFVLPSYTENFGMTVVEAMACGLPVVISDQVNIHTEVAEAGAGRITRCDANEVAHELIDLLNDPDQRSKMGMAGRHEARVRYSWSNIVNAFTQEYEAVIARSRSIKDYDSRTYALTK